MPDRDSDTRQSDPLVDISWVNPHRAEYYLADRSNKGIDIIDTETNSFKKTIGGFVGIKLTTTGAVDNNHSGPDGVTSHGRWLYAGDGNSTLKVIDLVTGKIVATLSTHGTTRLDEMALTTDGTLLLAVNNAEDPPFATLFSANGDEDENSVTEIAKITVDRPSFPPDLGFRSSSLPGIEPQNGSSCRCRSLPIIPRIATTGRAPAHLPAVARFW